MTRVTTKSTGLIPLSILATMASLSLASCSSDEPSLATSKRSTAVDNEHSASSTGQSTQFELPFPEEIINPPWLESGRAAQLSTVGQFKVFYDFTFSDRLEESGITFRHRITPDSGRDYRPNHYDHGNGRLGGGRSGGRIGLFRRYRQ